MEVLEMTFDYVNKTYGVKASRGSRVKTPDGKTGTITRASVFYVHVRLDGKKFSIPYHPTDLKYLPKEEKDERPDA